MTDEERRTQLANFLRTCRQMLQPEQVGIQRQCSHPRTQGLRREEVAELATISVTWYTWLEQGRAIHVSKPLLSRLADALQLNAAQREYLFALGLQQLPIHSHLSEAPMSPKLQRLLDAQGTNPAIALGCHLDILAWNIPATSIFCNFDEIPVSRRNAILLLFSEHARKLVVNWEPHVQYLLAALRTTWSLHTNDPWFGKFIAQLNKYSPEFRAWWPRHDVWQPLEADTELDHPIVGHLVLEHHLFQTPETPDLRVVFYTPQPGTDTATKLEVLCHK